MSGTFMAGLYDWNFSDETVPTFPKDLFDSPHWQRDMLSQSSNLPAGSTSIAARKFTAVTRHVWVSQGMRTIQLNTVENVKALGAKDFDGYFLEKKNTPLVI